PLISIATDKAVEVVEAHAGGPLVEGAGLARLEVRRVVIFAKPGCPIAIVLQNLANRCLVTGHEGVIAGKACSLLGDNPEAHRVMIAASDDGGARRRA